MKAPQFDPTQGSLRSALNQKSGGSGRGLMIAAVGVILYLIGSSPTGPSGQIAYSSDEPGDHDVLVLDIICAQNPSTCETINPLRFTNSIGEDYEPYWSYDGSRLAFVSDRDGDADIYLADAECATPPGGCSDEDLIRLTDNNAQDSGPIFSYACRGKSSSCVEWLTFDSDRTGNWEIFMMPVPDNPGERLEEATQLTEHPANDWWPTWSPDGQKVAFMSDRDSFFLMDILVLDLKTGEVRNLTNSPDIDEAFPAWSPDGSRIAFASDATGDYRIYTMNAATGGNVQQISSDADGDDYEPAWSLDSKWLAFTSNREGEGDYELFMVWAGGGEPIQLTDNDYIEDWGPAWRP
jgi:Tol biopolymer transport system component